MYNKWQNNTKAVRSLKAGQRTNDKGWRHEKSIASSQKW